MVRAKLDDQFDDEPYGLIDALKDRFGRTVAKPSNIAWSVGCIVTVGFVFSNALFFQNGVHPSAFFETRGAVADRGLQADELELPLTGKPVSANDQNADTEKPVTRIVFDASEPAVEQTAALPKVAVRPTNEPVALPTIAETIKSDELQLGELQGLLAELKFYDGDIDGLSGPKTRAAIEAYKANVGLRGIDLTYAELATSARNNLIVTAAIPKTRPATQETATPLPTRQADSNRYTPPTAQPNKVATNSTPPSNTVTKVQAGLRAFGNENVTVDGIAGGQTAAAIKEFQSLFKLPVTGKIDKQLVEKMATVGLIN